MSYVFNRLTPLGVMSLILVSIAEIDDITIIFKELGIFVALVTAGIVIHQILVLPAIFFVIVRRNPYPLFIDSSKAWLICFSTTSTYVHSALLPCFFISVDTYEGPSI